MRLVILTALGIGGATVAGALLGFCFQKIPHRWNDGIMGFASGVMLAAAVSGQGDLATAVEEVKLRTRQYAKRQLTWFRRNTATPWYLWGAEPDFAACRQASTEKLEEYGL